MSFRDIQRLQARSSVQPCNTPSSTIFRGAVGRPSPSNGRDPVTLGRCGSSMIDKLGGKTSFSRLLRNHDPPRAIAAPFAAASRWVISEAEMRSSNKTGNAPVFGLHAPSRSRLRFAARRPISDAARRSLWKIRLSLS